MLHLPETKFPPVDAEALTRALGGKWHGRYGVACCPAHYDKTPSLSLNNGDDGRLLARCHAGCAFEAVIDALRRRGMLLNPLHPMQAGKIAEKPSRRSEHIKNSLKVQWTRQLWNEAQPIAATPAETYLRGRGITCPLNRSLRYHPACRHPLGRMLPAMIGLVEGGDGFAVHRTWLMPDGSGKADALPAKAMMGPTAGGAVRLSEGGERLVVAEGIETALSLLSGLLDGPAMVWASLSTSGMRSLRLPTSSGSLIIAPDDDKPGWAAAYALAQRAHSAGWDVSFLEPPSGGDFNDLLVGKAVTA